jgi:acylphosphatase
MMPGDATGVRPQCAVPLKIMKMRERGISGMAGEQENQRLTATVTGYVQGVGYRYYALQHARALGLTGFARNERDGSVTVVAEGPKTLLAQLLAALQRGPEGADVYGADPQWRSATGEFPSFRIAASL